MEDTLDQQAPGQTVPEVGHLPRALVRSPERAEPCQDGSNDADLAGKADPDDKPTGNTGNTGNTSQTMFVSPGPQGGASPREDEFTEDEVFGAIQRAPRWVTRTAPALLLLAVIAYSAWALQDFSRSIPADSPASTREKAAGLSDATTSSLKEQPLNVPTSLPRRGTEATHLLGTQLERVLAGEESDHVYLDDVILEQKITVLNLWATYCKPCKRELPELKRMFDNASWGDKARFVSVHAPTDEHHAAYDEYAPRMPSRENFLVEIEAGNISGALQQDGTTDKAALPLTVVLDCRREIRFNHVGELSGADFQALRPLIDELVAEIDTPFCAQPPAETPKIVRRKRKVELADESTTSGGEELQPEPAKAGPRCGDGRCNGRETCDSCATDCACDDTSKCAPRQSGGGYICIKGVNALKG